MDIRSFLQGIRGESENMRRDDRRTSRRRPWPCWPNAERAGRRRAGLAVHVGRTRKENRNESNCDTKHLSLLHVIQISLSESFLWCTNSWTDYTASLVHFHARYIACTLALSPCFSSLFAYSWLNHWFSRPITEVELRAWVLLPVLVDGILWISGTCLDTKISSYLWLMARCYLPILWLYSRISCLRRSLHFQWTYLYEYMQHSILSISQFLQDIRKGMYSVTESGDSETNRRLLVNYDLEDVSANVPQVYKILVEKRGPFHSLLDSYFSLRDLTPISILTMFRPEDIILRPKSTLKKGNACITCRYGSLQLPMRVLFSDHCHAFEITIIGEGRWSILSSIFTMMILFHWRFYI